MNEVYGYLTSGDIAQISPLKGQQVHFFLEDYGVEIQGRMRIKESDLRKLESMHKLDAYRGYPIWSEIVRKLRRPYRKRVKHGSNVIG